MFGVNRSSSFSNLALRAEVEKTRHGCMPLEVWKNQMGDAYALR